MKKIFLLFVLFAAICFSEELMAQPPNPGGGGTNSQPGCFPPPCVPIDGGLSWLLLAGTVYGGRKLYNSNTSQKEEL